MKRDILIQADYRYNFDRDMYINRDQKKAFSLAFVDDSPEEEIASKIREHTPMNGWTFYTNAQLSDGVKHELERVLG